MRIDFVITELFVGGAERCLTELVTALAASGDQLRVFSIGALPTGQQRALVDRLQEAGIDVRSCNADSQYQFAGAYRQLGNWFRQSPPEICQTFLFHANVLGTMAARSAGVAARIGGIRVAEERPVRCWIERRSALRMQRVVCVSGAVEQFAQQRLGCRRDQTVVIPNGVDVIRFSSAAPIGWSAIGWPEDSQVVLFVGRLHPQKGIDLLQQQIDSIAPAKSNRRLLLVGEGPLSERLESWAGQVGNDRVRVLPWQIEIAPLMRACHLLVLPSRYEGMPNVVLEAMAAGRPVVCSDIEGSEELFCHSRPLQVFPSGDSRAMNNLVQQFLSDEVLSEKIGRDNQAHVRSHFSLDAMIDAYRGLYRTVLSNSCHGL